MNRRVLVSVLLLICNFFAQAQYKFVNEFPLDLTLPSGGNIYDFCYRINGDTICYLEQLTSKKSGKKDLSVTRLYFESGEIISNDTLKDVSQSFKVSDLTYNSKCVFITGHEKYIKYNFGSPSSLTVKMKYKEGVIADSLPTFKYCDFLNDSLVLLYNIYNYHPLDGEPGMYINIYNVNSSKFEKSILKRYKGVAVSYINPNLVSVINENIFVLTPLSWELSIYNKDLELLKKSKLLLADSGSLNDNISLESYLDSIVYNGYDNFHNSIKNKSKNIANDYFDKEDIVSLLYYLDSTKNFPDYIFKFDDSTLGISLKKINYKNEFRDVVLVNSNTLEIGKKYTKWRCKSPNEIQSLEELFPVMVYANECARPTFNNRGIYLLSMIDPALFEKSSAEELSKKIMNDRIKNGYKCRIIQYELD